MTNDGKVRNAFLAPPLSIVASKPHTTTTALAHPVALDMSYSTGCQYPLPQDAENDALLAHATPRGTVDGYMQPSGRTHGSSPTNNFWGDASASTPSEPGHFDLGHSIGVVDADQVKQGHDALRGLWSFLIPLPGSFSKSMVDETTAIRLAAFCFTVYITYDRRVRVCERPPERW